MAAAIAGISAVGDIAGGIMGIVAAGRVAEASQKDYETQQLLSQSMREQQQHDARESALGFGRGLYGLATKETAEARTALQRSKAGYGDATAALQMSREGSRMMGALSDRSVRAPAGPTEQRLPGSAQPDNTSFYLGLVIVGGAAAGLWWYLR